MFRLLEKKAKVLPLAGKVLWIYGNIGLTQLNCWHGTKTDIRKGLGSCFPSNQNGVDSILGISWITKGTKKWRECMGIEPTESLCQTPRWF